MQKGFLNFFYLPLFAFLIFSCSKKEKKYDQEKAISAFSIINQIKVDSALENVAIKIPAQQKNEYWQISSFLQNNNIENFFLEQSSNNSNKKIKERSHIWSGYRPNFSDRFVFSPVIFNNKIFTLDASGILSCHGLDDKKLIWETKLFSRRLFKNYQSPKISYYQNKIFAISGVNQVIAVDDSGKILWDKKISSLPISAPISDGNFVYVLTNDNKTYALNSQSGELQWVHSGILRTTAIFGSANPVINQNFVISSYSSGEIYALSKKTGEVLWTQDLNISKAINSDFYLNDIDATPIIRDNILYSIGNGGLMMAIDLKNGQYIWKKELAGISDFWLAGDFLFLINNESKLLAIYKKTGAIKWINQLPAFKKEKKSEGKIIYNGLVMAGDKLLITTNNGTIITASPIDGKIENKIKINQKIFHIPVIVNGKIYLHVLGRYSADLIEFKIDN
jgi:outer membrane protein assembly factor BamB